MRYNKSIDNIVRGIKDKGIILIEDKVAEKERVVKIVVDEKYIEDIAHLFVNGSPRENDIMSIDKISYSFVSLKSVLNEKMQIVHLVCMRNECMRRLVKVFFRYLHYKPF